MLKACSRCGKIHAFNYICNVGRERSFRDRKDKEASRLRSTNAWKKKREAIRELSFNLCEVCRAQGIYNYTDIEIHHIKKLSEDTTGFLDDDNLIALCVKHHKQADRNELDADYLRELVKLRQGETGQAVNIDTRPSQN